MVIQGIQYVVLDVFSDSITIPDSFAAQSNKFGKGHGEAKLYIASKQKLQKFFNNNVDCFVLKEDFDHYIRCLHSAQSVLSSIYRNAVSGNTNFKSILNNITKVVSLMQPKVDFKIKLMNNIKGSRGYINSSSKSSLGYNYLRDCCIPFATFIRILKLQEQQTGNTVFYMKLFPNFEELYKQVQYIKNYGKKNIFASPTIRTGQTKYKSKLIETFKECPFTQIQDERLLVASHIKPFVSCNPSEKYDSENGLLLSPLYDKLFDRGFITFDQNGILKKSIWLSPSEWNNIPLQYSIGNLHLTPQRKSYLKFHETHVFLG